MPPVSCNTPLLRGYLPVLLDVVLRPLLNRNNEAEQPSKVEM